MAELGLAILWCQDQRILGKEHNSGPGPFFIDGETEFWRDTQVFNGQARCRMYVLLWGSVLRQPLLLAWATILLLEHSSGPLASLVPFGATGSRLRAWRPAWPKQRGLGFVMEY